MQNYKHTAIQSKTHADQPPIEAISKPKAREERQMPGQAAQYQLFCNCSAKDVINPSPKKPKIGLDMERLMLPHVQ